MTSMGTIAKALLQQQQYDGGEFDLLLMARVLRAPLKRVMQVMEILNPLGIFQRTGRTTYVCTGNLKLYKEHTYGRWGQGSKLRKVSCKLLNYLLLASQTEDRVGIPTVLQSFAGKNRNMIIKLAELTAVYEELGLIKMDRQRREIIIGKKFRLIEQANTLPPAKKHVLIPLFLRGVIEE